ncbi:MAG: YifB family Mg chelatase-like AAA ATPase [Halioglobus sp.]
MDLSVVYSRALAGIDAPLVRVETHLANGLPAFNIVGLPETTVRESKDRVRSAIINSHFTFPDRRITINLAPADLPKEGGRFDLPIALGILSASGQIPSDRMSAHEFVGELALDGSLRPVPGIVAAASAARGSNRNIAVAMECGPRAAQVPDAAVVAAPDILTLCAHLNGSVPIEPTCTPTAAKSVTPADLKDVIGQPAARRALEVAATGGHNLLFWGPPGTGKTLLASRLPGILPDIDASEALEGLALRDTLATSLPDTALYARPFRNPHHSASATALVGGGNKPQPGEVSLAHGGVLFLDELPEFNRHCLEVLREPLESGEITLSRARYKVTYPARFQLIAAMNPCPCGYLGDRERACHCTPQQVQRYRARVSGPLLDRIDLQVQVSRLPANQLISQSREGESSACVRKRVTKVRAIQHARQGSSNAHASSQTIMQACNLGHAESDYLVAAADQLLLSGRGLHRTLRVARTIADMAGAEQVDISHLNESLAYRNQDAG